MHHPASPGSAAQGLRLPSPPAPVRLEQEPRLAQVANSHPCPHCGSSRTQGHGSFGRNDGTRQPRTLCLRCGRTFSPTTGTPLHYLKKRAQWARMVENMGQGITVRKMAAIVGVQVSTAFKWRHRLLSPLSGQPQPVLSGSVATREAYIPYSEKGRRRSGGPGARGNRLSPVGDPAKGRRFRRFIDGKPSCVLVARAGEQLAAVIVSRGRPRHQELQVFLAELLGAGAELWASGLAPYQEVCRNLGVPFRGSNTGQGVGRGSHLCHGAAIYCPSLCGWMLQFRGVATRYLSHYLAWFRIACRHAQLDPAEISRQLAMGARLPVRPGAAA